LRGSRAPVVFGLVWVRYAGPEDRAVSLVPVANYKVLPLVVGSGSAQSTYASRPLVRSGDATAGGIAIPASHSH